MKTQKRNGAEERTILIGMLTDIKVMAVLSSMWEGQMFYSKWSNLVGRWCVSHYQKYEKILGADIEVRFQTWASKTKDEATRNLIEEFLSNLSDEYEQKNPNTAYILDISNEYFSKKRLGDYASEIQEALEEGRVEEARNLAEGFSLPSTDVGTYIDPFTDIEAAKRAHSGNGESLVKYPGELGRFFGSAFERDSFVAFMAPEKRGKSFWLLDLVWRASLQRKKVAYFEVGDMSESQVLRRLHSRAARRPVRQKPFQYPTRLEPPEEIGKEALVKLEERDVTSKMNWQEGHDAMVKAYGKAKTHENMLRLSCHPNSSINADGIRHIIKSWARSGWIADFVVVDYADILAPCPSTELKTDTRESINMTWKSLRRLSQEMHCCVVTATQADASSYSAGILGMKNFTDDKRKFSHVTAMLGINQTPIEKKKGLTRLNYLVLRDDEFHTLECVHAAGCPAIANPAIRSVRSF